MEKVLIVENQFGKWIIQKLDNPNLGWTGARWAEHYNGIPTGAIQIANFRTISGASAYASSFGFEVVGIEQEMI